MRGETFTWADVTAAARELGDWQELERATAEGLACLRRLTASGEELDASALAPDEEEFRRARRLLSGEETVAWLQQWGLTLADWRDYLRCTVLAERWAGELDETVARFPAPEAEVAAALWAHAVCSGLLERVAHRLAADSALAPDATDRTSIADAANRARAEAITDEAVEHEVSTHTLEWLRFETSLVELPSEDIAREAALCVRDDRRPLADVAAECGTEARPLTLYLGEIEPHVSALLIGAGEGDLVGPLAWKNGFALLLVEAKVAATASDPEVRRKAEQRIVEHVDQRATAAEVTWHEHL